VSRKDYHAVVVGAGPNGLAAAITLQSVGLSVLLVESKRTVGGGLRSAELTEPGYIHDVCSAIHPLAAGSPFFSRLPLEEHGLEYIYPTLDAAHPFDDGTAAVLERSPEYTGRMLGRDEHAYRSLIEPIVNDWPILANSILGPLRIPEHPVALARFGLRALQSAQRVSKHFHTVKARGFWAGMAGHSMLPLEYASTAAIGLVLLAAGHTRGWPIPKGGSQSIANALAAYFVKLGGTIETNLHIESLNQLPSAQAVLLDVAPRQLLNIAGHTFSKIYKWQLNRYRYGMGVFKIDWALNEPIPFTAEACRLSGTVHIGNTFNEIAGAEDAAWNGRHTDKPYVLVAQQSLFDQSRAPRDKHTAWGYCHVPSGSTEDLTTVIEKQIERFAPGFRDTIRARHTMNSSQMEAYNANYIGGDINGGAIDITQLFTRPALRWSPYRTSTKGIYICSASTPPGGGVHGMCGFHAANRALKDIFGLPPIALRDKKHHAGV
jgi:phytoene dehydrogenase-like protein